MTAIAAAEKKKKKDEMYYKFNTSRGMGYWKSRTRNYEDAVKLFTTAIEHLEPDTGLEVPLTIARSKAYTRMVDHEAARKDALAVVESHPSDIRGLENDAFTLYEKDDFEDSLVRNYRGFRERRKPDCFYKGILVGKETIEDTVGRNAGPCLDHERLGNVIVNMHVNPRTVSVAGDKLAQAKNKYEGERIDRFLSQKYLGRLANDKLFLQDFLKMPELKSGNKDHNKQLGDLVTHMIETINRQQETLMTQRPMYMLRHHEPQFSQRYIDKRREADKRLKFGVVQVVYKLLGEASKLQRDRKIADCMSVYERLRRFVECQSASNLMSSSTKEQVLDKLYETVGRLFMDTKTFLTQWSESENNERIEFILGSHIDKPRFVDKVRSTYFPHIWNVKEMKQTLESQLLLSTHRIERAFLYHELSRCYFEEGTSSVEKAYKAAAAGYRIAKETKNILWSFNLGFLTALAILMEGNTDDAKVAFREVNINARKLERDDCASFIQKVMKIAAEPDKLEYEPPMLQEHHQQQLLRLMPTPELRAKAHMVLQRVSTAPHRAKLQLKPSQAQFKPVAQGSSRRSLRQATIAKRRTLVEVKSRHQTQHFIPSKIDLTSVD